MSYTDRKLTRKERKEYRKTASPRVKPKIDYSLLESDGIVTVYMPEPSSKDSTDRMSKIIKVAKFHLTEDLRNSSRPNYPGQFAVNNVETVKNVQDQFPVNDAIHQVPEDWVRVEMWKIVR